MYRKIICLRCVKDIVALSGMREKRTDGRCLMSTVFARAIMVTAGDSITLIEMRERSRCMRVAQTIVSECSKMNQKVRVSRRNSVTFSQRRKMLIFIKYICLIFFLIFLYKNTDCIITEIC